MKPEVRLTLTVLGGFHAQLEPDRALVLPTKKAQALLAYLALPAGQVHPRVAAWQRSPAPSKRRSIRTASSSSSQRMPSPSYRTMGC